MKNIFLISIIFYSIVKYSDIFARGRPVRDCPDICHNKKVTKSRWDISIKKIYVPKIEGGNGGDGALGGKIIINSKSNVSLVTVLYGGLGGKAGNNSIGYRSTKIEAPTNGTKGKNGFIFINSPKI